MLLAVFYQRGFTCAFLCLIDDRLQANPALANTVFWVLGQSAKDEPARDLVMWCQVALPAFTGQAMASAAQVQRLALDYAEQLLRRYVCVCVYCICYFFIDN